MKLLNRMGPEHRRVRSRSWAWLALLLVASLVTACASVAERAIEEAAEKAAESGGGGDVEIDLSEDGASVRAEGEDFSVEMGSGAGLPDGLAIPVPDGGAVTTSGNQGSYLFVAIQYPLSRFDEIVDFYGDWTSGDAEDWQRAESTFSSEDVTYRHVQWLSGPSTIAVDDCITLDDDTPMAVCVTVNQSG